MRMSLMVILCGILAGCVSSPSSVAPVNAYCVQYDCEKMQRVSKDARRNGHIVFWVTPPLKEKSQRS